MFVRGDIQCTGDITLESGADIWACVDEKTNFNSMDIVINGDLNLTGGLHIRKGIKVMATGNIKFGMP